MDDASSGPYDVPAALNGWTLEEHSADRVVWARNALRDGLLNRVRALFGNGRRTRVEIIVRKQNGNWSVVRQEGPYTMAITGSSALPDDTADDLERRRAFWHAKQSLLGRQLTPAERGRVAYTGTVSDRLINDLGEGERDADDVMDEIEATYEKTMDDIEDIDAFFDAPKEEQQAPFADVN